VQVRGRYINPGVPIFDEQFESQLPPEVRAELELPPRAINRWPERIPETEEEIQAALIWLKSQGYLQNVSAPPLSPEPASPQQPPVVPPAAKPVQRESQGGSGDLVVAGNNYRIATFARPVGGQHVASNSAGGNSSGVAGTDDERGSSQSAANCPTRSARQRERESAGTHALIQIFLSTILWHLILKLYVANFSSFSRLRLALLAHQSV
jgi:hypothetical protein